MKYDLINVSASEQISLMTYDPITSNIKQVEKNYTLGTFLIWKQPVETYFPPQKILVVITRLERLKMRNESTSVTTAAKHRESYSKKASCVGSW